MNDDTPKGIDWKAIAKRFHEHNQQRLQDNAELLEGPAARALWPSKEDEKEKADE